MSKRLHHYTLKGRTITVKVKYSDFKIITRSQSFLQGVNDKDTIAATAQQLLAAADLNNKKVRLLGISLSNFGEVIVREKRDPVQDQLKLF